MDTVVTDLRSEKGPSLDQYIMLLSVKPRCAAPPSSDGGLDQNLSRLTARLTSELWTGSPQLCGQPGEQRTGKLITLTPCETGPAQVAVQEREPTGELVSRCDGNS